MLVPVKRLARLLMFFDLQRSHYFLCKNHDEFINRSVKSVIRKCTISPQSADTAYRFHILS